MPKKTLYIFHFCIDILYRVCYYITIERGKPLRNLGKEVKQLDSVIPAIQLATAIIALTTAIITLISKRK